MSDVVATGLAKSMSNEDNVGHCTSLAALVPKIDALLHRLLARVVSLACLMFHFHVPCPVPHPLGF